MNPVLLLLIILFLIFLFFVMAFTFVPIGRIFHRLLSNARREIEREDEE